MSSVPDRITLLNRANNGGRPEMVYPRNSSNVHTFRSSAPNSNKNVIIAGYGSSTENNQTQVMGQGL
jgi:hypothetical protein